MTDSSNPVVMVVDDDPAVRLLCEQSLGPTGFNVSCFPDGVSALEALSALQPDIILLDVEMPGTDGFSVCQEIRARKSTADIPVVMITGNDDTESINRAYVLGATDFIRKPIVWAVLPHRVRYILRAKAAFADLRRAEQKTRALLKAIPDMILSIDSKGVIQELVGGDMRYSDGCENHVGQALESFFPPAVAKTVREFMHVALAKGGVHVCEHVLADNKRYCETRLIARDENNVLAIVRDITDRKESAAKIHRLAYYDNLTGLPNRQQFLRDLRLAIAIGRREETSIALLFIDLDRFKRINDTLGHSVGDMLLKSVAKRLENCVRNSDYVARLDTQDLPNVQLSRVGGDEFVILMTNIKYEEETSVVTKRIVDALAAPFNFKNHQFVVTPSVGIAMFPGDGDNVEDLMMNADIAMYRAKSAGRNMYRFYSDTMRTRSLERLDLEADLRKAIANGEFCLHYQPKVEIATWSIVGVEALLRWNHAERGWISPGDFIPIAEDTGLIEQVGEWVIREACAQLRKWQDSDLDKLSIAVNVSSKQISGGDFLHTVLNIVEKAAVRPQLLELEITESMLMTDVQETVAALVSLREAGFRLSVDDFGTGYSSLAYLKQFPLNALKIDRSFVQGLHQNADGATICTAILAMAKELGLKVIAEGVEFEEQLEFLRKHQCDEIQGFLFSKPLPANELEELVRRHKSVDVVVTL